jgi:tRNA(Ile)-lysidine synthase
LLIDFFNKLPDKKQSLLIAVSGGADSVALLYLLHRSRDLLGIESIAVAHVNHGLRGDDADLDEALVQSLANSLRVPFFTKKLSGITLDSSGIEDYCRSQRYAFFHHLKEKHNFDYIVTAHTADDQAETLLMKIIRGCGIRGLTGIHEVREDAVIRPLLGITKKELLCFLKENNITWREDVTNSNIKFSRNNIRHNVLPLLETINPHVREHLVMLGRSAARTIHILEKYYLEWRAKFIIHESDVHFEVSRDGFSDIGISDCVFRIFRDHGIECTSNKIADLIYYSCATSGRYLISDGWSMYGVRNSLLFLKDGTRIPALNEAVAVQGETKICHGRIRISLQYSDTFERNANKFTAFVDSAFLNGSLVLRTVEAGDCFVPLGRKKDVSVLSFLESQGYCKIDRERMVVLFSGPNVVWIPGIRLSDHVKVTDLTKSITKISFQLHTHIV